MPHERCFATLVLKFEFWSIFQGLGALSEEHKSVNGIGSTLATVWRIAAPYFRSEDKWAGRGLLAAVIAIERMIVAINVLLNAWNNRFYNALQENSWGGFVRAVGRFSLLATCYIALSVYQL